MHKTARPTTRAKNTTPPTTIPAITPAFTGRRDNDVAIALLAGSVGGVVPGIVRVDSGFAGWPSSVVTYVRPMDMITNIGMRAVLLGRG
jgi:hypothetical protein